MEQGSFLGGVLAARIAAPGGESNDGDFDQLRRERHELISQITARFHGQYRPTSGGGVLAVFDSVNAAATAAVALQRQFPQKLGTLSCAVGGGEIVATATGFGGQPVDKVLDMLDASGPGQVLVSSLARMLAGNRLAYPLLESASAGRVPSSALRWQPALPLEHELLPPPALTVHDAEPFVGRLTEREALRQLLDRVLAGETQWCAVVAGAGLGKTRLLSELAEEARKLGVGVVGGASDEDLARPFAPIAQALSKVVDSVADLPPRLGPGAGDLVRILPQIRERLLDLPPPVQGDSHTERQALFGAVAGWLGSLAAECPLLVLLDSLHWEGDSTFELLLHLVSQIGGRPMLIVTSHRTGDRRTDRLLKAARQALGEKQVSELSLGGLDAQEIREFLGGEASGATLGDEGVIQSLLEATAGSPLHLKEVKRQPVPLAPASQEVDLGQVVRTRFAGLDKTLQAVIEAASVVGEIFELKEVVAICRAEDDVIDALDRAVDEGLVHLLDSMRLSYRFAHSLTREAVYQGVGAARRAKLHHRAGQAIEERGGAEVRQRINDLARHYSRAASLGYELQAVRYTLLAGDRALEQFANEMALGHFEHGLELFSEIPDSKLRIDLLTGLGRARRRVGHPEYRTPLFDAADLALADKDGSRMAVAVFAAYRGSYTRALHVDGDAVSRLEQALGLLGPEDPGHRARLLSLLAIELTWDSNRTRAIEASDRAIETARAAAPELLLQVLAHALWVKFSPWPARLAVAAELEELTRADSDPRLCFEIASHEVFTATRLGDPHRLAAARERAAALARCVGQPGERSMLLLRETTVALMEARYADVMAHMAERRELAREIGEADGEAAYRIHQFWLAYDQASPQQCAQLIEMAGARLEPHQRFFAWPTLLTLAVDTGQEALARRIVATMAEEGFDQIPQDQMWLWNLAQLAYAVARLRLRDHVDALWELLQPEAEAQANMVFNTLGSVHRYLGLLQECQGDLTGAREALLKAIEANRHIGAVTWVARCQLDLARLDVAMGRDCDAAIHEAQATAERLKLPLLLAQLQEFRDA
ncbi:MAG: AAA family ATPase [Pseudomonadota bacterium]